MSIALNLITSDPLHILSSTKPIVENSTLITINQDSVAEVVAQVQSRLSIGLDDPIAGLGITGDPAVDLPLVLIEDFCNFCFWAEKDQPKWTVEWPLGTIQDGWYALVACFRRALSEDVPILDPSYLSSLSLPQVEHLFRSSDGSHIPLINERLTNLREAGQILTSRFESSFSHWLATTGYDAVKIVQKLADDFPSFRDVATYSGHPVYFYKRAQWAAHSLTYLKGISISNIDQIAAFADYKLPQILRHLEVFTYSPELARLIDTYTLIKQGSREEVELRAATVWAVELIRQSLPSATAADVDNALWLLSQNLSSPSPYHRTYTIYY